MQSAEAPPFKEGRIKYHLGLFWMFCKKKSYIFNLRRWYWNKGLHSNVNIHLFSMSIQNLCFGSTVQRTVHVHWKSKRTQNGTLKYVLVFSWFWVCMAAWHVCMAICKTWRTHLSHYALSSAADAAFQQNFIDRTVVSMDNTTIKHRMT